MFHPNYKMLLWHNPHERFLPESRLEPRFRLVLIESGTGILRFGDHRETFIAPALFCLNELEIPELEQHLGFQGQALYFHPNVINGVFTFENVRSNTPNFSVTDTQDRYWLYPFLQRKPEYNGQLRIGPVTCQRISNLFQAVSRELAQQRDRNWPCRSRSFFLELLFLVESVFSAPQIIEENILSNSPCDMDAVILYLHTHYQEKITIECLAQIFYTNRTTLTEQFREVTGLPVMTYLNRLRLQVAALMLRDTELAVSEVLARVGFNDNTHFGRMFRKYTGHSPREYRRRFCWMVQ